MNVLSISFFVLLTGTSAVFGGVIPNSSVEALPAPVGPNEPTLPANANSGPAYSPNQPLFPSLANYLIFAPLVDFNNRLNNAATQLFVNENRFGKMLLRPIQAGTQAANNVMARMNATLVSLAESNGAAQQPAGEPLPTPPATTTLPQKSNGTPIFLLPIVWAQNAINATVARVGERVTNLGQSVQNAGQNVQDVSKDMQAQLDNLAKEIQAIQGANVENGTVTPTTQASFVEATTQVPLATTVGATIEVTTPVPLTTNVIPPQ